MKYLKSLIAILAFFHVATALGKEIKFEIIWKTSFETTNDTGEQEEGAQAFVRINGSEVYFYRGERVFDDLYNKRATSVGYADSSLLEIGRNIVRFDWVIGNSPRFQSLPNEGWTESILYAYLPDSNGKIKPRQLCRDYRIPAGISSDCLNKAFNFSLKELDPALAKQIESLRRELNTNRDLYERLKNGYPQVEKLFSLLPLTSLEVLSKEDLNAFKDILALLEATNSEIAALRNQNQKSKDRIEEELKKLKQLVDERAKDSGIDLGDGSGSLEYKVEENIEVVEDPINEEDIENSAYVLMARATIQILDDFYRRADGESFFKTLYQWINDQQILKEGVFLEGQSNPVVIASFEHSQSLVYGYLFGGRDTDFTGILNEDFWFKDSPVSEQVRSLLSERLSERNPVLSARFIKILQSLHPNSANMKLARQKIEILKELLVTYRTAKEGSEISYLESIMGGLASVWESREEIASCFLKTTAAGPYAAYYELNSGLSFCDDEPTSWIDDSLNVLDLSVFIAGTVTTGGGGAAAEKLIASIKTIGNVAKKTAKAVRSQRLSKVVELSSQLTKIANYQVGSAKNLLYSATKLGLKTKEGISNYFEALKTPFFKNPESGAIDISWLNRFIDASSRSSAEILGKATGTISRDGVLLVTRASRKNTKGQFLFNNSNDAKNWAATKLGPGKTRTYDSSGKWVGWENPEGHKIYWGHSDWGSGPGLSKFPHINFDFGKLKGHLFLKDKLQNRNEWSGFLDEIKNLGTE